MPAHYRGEIWLGDLIAALGELAPDDAALEVSASLLGLTPRRAAARPGRPARQLFEREQPHEASPQAVAETAAREAAAQTEGTQPVGSSHRLPLLATPTAGAPPADAAGPEWLPSQPALPGVDRFVDPRPAPPLLPARTRRAVLARLLATTAYDGAPDLARIVAQVGRGVPLTRLPRQARPTLRHGAELRCDFAPWLEPFAADQEDLLHALVRLLPAGRLRALAIRGAPEPLADEPDAVLRTGTPSANAPLLLASDLGRAWRALGERGATPAQWRQFIDRQHKAGQRVAVLAPAAHAGARRLRGVALLPWAERSGLGDVRRALLGQGRWPRPAPPQAVQRLAAQVSVAQQVSLWHLRTARRTLGQSPAAESELWFSDLVQSRGIEGLVIVPAAAVALRAGLDGERLHQALALRDAAHEGRHADDGQGLEESLHELELTHQLDAHSAEQVLRPALKSLAEGDRDVALWAAHAWERLSPAVHEQPAVRQLAFAASSLLATGAWLVDAQGRRPTLPGDSAWLLRNVPAERDPVGVELRDYADGSRNLVFGPADKAPTNAYAVIDVPRTRPLWLRVSGGTEGPEWEQTVSLAPGATQQVDVPAGPQVGNVRIEAMDGSAWVLESTTSLEAAIDAALLVLQVGSGQRPVGVALTDSLAVVPNGPGGLEALTRAEYGERLQYHPPKAEGVALSAIVVGTLNVRTLSVAVLRREAGAPWTPIDPQLRMVGPVDPQAPSPPARFILLTGRGAEPGPAIVSESWAIYAQPEKGEYAPALGSLIVPSGEGEWHLAWGTEPDVVQERRHPNDNEVSSVAWPDLLAQVQAFDARTRRWRWLLIGSPDVEKLSFRLYDEFARHRDEVEVDYDHDGRVFRALRPALPTDPSSSPIKGCDALLIVAGAKPPHELPELVQRALLSDMPRVWLPLGGGPQESLRDWPPDLVQALMRWQASRVDARALRAGDQAAFDSVVKEVLSMPSSGQRREAAEDASAVPVTPLAPARTPSLRARLLNALDKRSDIEIGLFRVGFGETAGITLEPESWPRSGAATLLLIHGEVSDAEPNFGNLLNTRDEHWQRLRETYAGRVMAWRWRSVTVGPVPNALALARALGGGAPVHVLSLGAGGLLPELMALAAALGTTPDALSQEALAHWRNAADTRPVDVNAWDNLVATVMRAPPDVRRFVRVACQVEGTDLFEREVRFGTSVGSMVLPLLGSTLLKLTGIDKLLSDPDVSPGLAALKPGAGLQPLLTPRLHTTMPLTVVAGAVRGDSIGSWLKSNLPTWAMGARESDLVVPLPSAFGGLERERGIDWVVDMGGQVSHFNYFTNERTRRLIVEALCAPEDEPPQGFRHANSLAELQQSFGARGAGEASSSMPA